jgi:hypothetical protein
VLRGHPVAAVRLVLTADPRRGGRTLAGFFDQGAVPGLRGAGGLWCAGRLEAGATGGRVRPTAKPSGVTFLTATACHPVLS